MTDHPWHKIDDLRNKNDEQWAVSHIFWLLFKRFFWSRLQVYYFTEDENDILIWKTAEIAPFGTV